MSVADFALKQLEVISDFCGNNYEEARTYFNKYIRQWLGDIKLRSSDRWQSWITDDGSPYDWSIVITNKGSVPRIVFEPQGEHNTAESMKEKAFDYVKFIQSESIINNQFLSVGSLLQEASNKNLWFATDFTPNPLFKIYFGGLSHESYKKVYDLLGIKSQIAHTEKFLASFDYVIEGISIDLNEQKDNRVKLYCRISNYAADNVVQLLKNSCRVYDPTVELLLSKFAVGDKIITHKRYEGEVYVPSNVLITFVYVKSLTMAACAKVHIPVRFHFANDSLILDATSKFIQDIFSKSLAMSYEEFIKKMANHRELGKRTGIQSLISYANPTGSDPELTVYISPEMYATERCVN